MYWFKICIHKYNINKVHIQHKFVQIILYICCIANLKSNIMKTVYRFINPAPVSMIVEQFNELTKESPVIFTWNEIEFSQRIAEDQLFIFDRSEKWLDGAQIIYVYNISREEIIRVGRKMGDCLIHEYKPETSILETEYTDLTDELL